jgi:hypothetical protein
VASGVTYQALERISHMPPDIRTGEQGDRIAGQFYYDVFFTGGTLSNIKLVTPFLNLRVVTVPGNVQVLNTDYTVVIKKTVDQITTVYAPSNPTSGQRFQVKDGNGHSVSFPITVDGNGFLIDGSPTIVLNTGYEALELTFDTTQWYITSSYSSSSIPPGTNFLTDELGNRLTDELGNRLVTG